MKVKIKKLHKDAVIPKYAKEGDAGLDLVATSKSFETKKDGTKIITYGTSLAIEIPHGFVGLVYPRSSICKKALILSNSVGVIDSGYRGEIMFKFRLDPNARPFQGQLYDIGDRVGQIIIMPYPSIEFEEVDGLEETGRGAGGFGSTGE